ncbi:Two-component system sensor protein [Enhygromyxa salina]|uniref:Two-component system sensor protein n=1 Tax=Enhygromyxa salina TaxID=215803 RepID=A0A0C1ZTD3_9BACT|nr:sensor histidine kinase [Enhygromyxa salina]KIG14298.1 Two-component system sensor protein [Enhygromyxa salina]
MRRLGIAGFGLMIPRVTPLLDGVGPGQLAYWLGTLWFLGLAAAIWHGNRWLLFEQRRHYGWFNHPLRKLSLLLAAIVLYTAPITVVALLAWYGWIGAVADADAIRTVALINVICVVFVTHAYETVFLIKEREGDLLRVARLDRARAEAELSGFLAQVDPHFLFNSLNTLGHLIKTDSRRAVAFNQDLAGIYRYLLRQRGRSLVTLAEELRFARAYLELMQIRYGEALRCELPKPMQAGARLPPTALQLLIENAIKHNEVGAGAPLEIEVGYAELEGAPCMFVANRRRPRRSVRESAGTGLRNLDERSKLAVGRGIQIDQRGEEFRVCVPLAMAAQECAS